MTMRNRDEVLVQLAKAALPLFKREGLTEESAQHEALSFAYSATEILADRLDEVEQVRDA
jgi:hypothetical protein